MDSRVRHENDTNRNGSLQGTRGFTLIEMAIVLTIVGLVVGGVLVGQDLIRASEVRSTVTQIEKYNTAVNTFNNKFGYLPGDITSAAASTYGFATRGTNAGQGDGNGNIQGYAGSAAGDFQATGETVMFWVDLSSAAAGNLIEGGFNTASSTVIPGADITGSNITLYFPQAKLGGGNYIYVFSGDYWNGSAFVSTGTNYFGLSAVTSIPAASAQGKLVSTANISVAKAYAIDKKVDDGMPQSGNVMAWYLQNSNGLNWCDGTHASLIANEPIPYSGSLSGSSSTCYDNGGNSIAPTQYSINQNHGAGGNCALSFQFQ